MSGDISDCRKLEGALVPTGVEWGEARDAIRHPTMHRIALTTKSYPVQYVNSAKVKKTCFKGMK